MRLPLPRIARWVSAVSRVCFVGLSRREAEDWAGSGTRGRRQRRGGARTPGAQRRSPVSSWHVCGGRASSRANAPRRGGPTRSGHGWKAAVLFCRASGGRSPQRVAVTFLLTGPSLRHTGLRVEPLSEYRWKLYAALVELFSITLNRKRSRERERNNEELVVACLLPPHTSITKAIAHSV